jgi:hypothetical protein
VGFSLKWDEKNLHEVVLNKDEDSMSSTSMRFIEAVTAYELGIPFNEAWYEIPLKSREYMIATRLGKEWLKNLHEDYAVRNMVK